METAYTVTGKLTDDRTVALDKPLPVGKGKVRLVVEPILASNRRSYGEVMAAIRSRQQERSHSRPKRGQVDEHVRQEREGWDQ
ncbi:MAG: hypothetical protein GKR89_24210 [Candidatus Latescibacteria bacterium]|nr:hypothetical protein [Candidatus Latescibacterota bacterium]